MSAAAPVDAHALFPPPDDGKEWTPVPRSHIAALVLFSMDSGEAVWLGRHPPDALPDEEAVRALYGGGRFQVRAQANSAAGKRAGTWLACRTWKMEGARKAPDAAPLVSASPAAPGPAGASAIDKLAGVLERHGSTVMGVVTLGMAFLESRNAAAKAEREAATAAATRQADEMRTLMLTLVGQQRSGQGEQLNAELLRAALNRNDNGINAELLRAALEQRGATSPIDHIKSLGELKKVLKGDDDGADLEKLLPMLPMVLGMLGGGGAPPNAPPLPPVA
jgi:hypothetical protein